MNPLNWIKALYQPPSAETLALRELEGARRSLLEAHSAREYADSMTKYHEQRVKRLTTFIHTATKEQQQ
jgi:hypothetical protein